MRKNDSLFQIIAIGILAFCCPGLFNAMQGLGGAGAENPESANNANTALYATFAVFGYFGGPIFSALGNRLCMFLGGLSYGVYAAGMYIVGNVDGAGWVAPVAGAILGMGAGVFWTAQGGMMLAYSTELNKGWYISLFWIIFNLGGMIGGLIAFGINFNQTGGQANPALYFTFIALMVGGSVSSLFILEKPENVIKEDGSAVVMRPGGSAIEEIKGALKVATNRHMVYLSAMFLASNWYVTYQLNYLNGLLFNIRTRGLNSTLYWGLQMAGAYGVGLILDSTSRSVRRNAVICYIVTNGIFLVSWIGSILVQYTFEGGYDKGNPPENTIDLTEPARGAGIVILFLLSAVADACLQAFSYWLIGGVAKGDTQLAARFSGFYKGIQSVGAAIAWSLDITTSYTTQLWVAIGLWLLSAITSWFAVRIVDSADSVVADVEDDPARV